MGKIKGVVSGAVCAALLLFGATGCEVSPPGTSNTNSAATPPAAPTTAPTPVASAATHNNFSITLPVLDAFFADDSFAAELKDKLQLTDEQITQLRNVAREETGKLREREGGEYAGTTDDARALYDEKITGVIGVDKARQLSDLVRARWNGQGGEATALPARPNAVPTDTRIVVNIPAYRMDVFEGGKLVKTYRVGIGYPEFPLPTGLRQADTIIFNPTWTPPDEPWVETPSSKVKPGQKVEAGSDLNPLGPVKIPIGLPSLIHGGKSPARLGNFASHGCVGLTNPQVQEFAQVLAKLGGSEITPEQIAEYEKNKTETKNVKLATPVPVELRYETILVADGKLHIYRDVYDRGTNTEENLRTVLETYGVSLDELSEEERRRVTDALRRMARDAKGQPVEAAATPAPTVSGKNENKNAVSSGRVTRNVKGEKEIVVEIAALKGKGYPAPVELNDGGAKRSTSAAKKR